MIKLVVLALAGAAGTLSRYWLSGFLLRHSRASFPYGTLAVNLIGCLVMGFVMQRAQDLRLQSDTRAVLVVGFLGAFTTFSAFGFETLELLRAGLPGMAMINVMANIVAGVALVWLGMLLAGGLAS